MRQAHPGPAEPTDRSDEQKLDDAEAFRDAETIPWPVLADDVCGTVHQAYGGTADAAYLIDRDGNVAFLNAVTCTPVLHEAITELSSQGGRGVVGGGANRRPHLGAAPTDGWRAVRRGLPPSAADLMWAAPGSPILFWLGHQLRPLLASLTLRAEPLPGAVRAALLVGAAGAATLAVRWLTHRRAVSH